MSDAKTSRDREDSRAMRRVSRKDQIISLFVSGITEIEDLAIITGARPSYVNSVLQSENLASGYFDLYTSTERPMNVYSKFFAGKLGFKDEATAQASIELINRLHDQFAFAGDRAGQHHALMMALTMFDRARWTGKRRESEIFRQWLIEQLGNAQFIEEEQAITGNADDSSALTHSRRKARMS